MPRNSSGTYTLPAGNPVISGEVITSNWANTTMPDLATAMTDSLSRTGQGGMLAPLPFVDGAVLTPSITFNLEPTLGFYRESTERMNAASGNRDVASFNLTNQIEVNRDYGGGLDWYPVADSNNVFNLQTEVNQNTSDISQLQGAAEKPVGALEFGYDPNGILPGVWTQLPEGTFLMNTIGAADPSGGSNDAVNIEHGHTLNNPAHGHAASQASHTHAKGFGDTPGPVGNGGTSSWATDSITGSAQPAVTVDDGVTTVSANNSGVPGTNLNKPLYEGVAIWKRTA